MIESLSERHSQVIENRLHSESRHEIRLDSISTPTLGAPFNHPTLKWFDDAVTYDIAYGSDTFKHIAAWIDVARRVDPAEEAPCGTWDRRRLRPLPEV